MKEHYPSLPAYAVYPALPSETDQDSYTILIVGNKYNNSNFWYLKDRIRVTLVGTADGALSINTIPKHPHSKEPSQSPYTILKMAMYY